MATVRNLSGRGTKGVLEVHGEVLFLPGTDLSRWKNRFSHRVRAATARHAPRNKRPRWGHYGKPLKSTMKAATRTRITKGGGFFYIGVGSTAPHAYYVDQGTGIHGGSGPYEAKILPPWQRGEASLYERTWRVGGPSLRNRPMKPVIIKGQKGQRFFEKGLRDGFRSMKLRSAQLPGEGASAMASALTSFPSGLGDFKGNTAADGAFRAQLDEWRKWRDDAWARGEMLGRRIRPEDKPEDRKPRRETSEEAENRRKYNESIAAAKRRAAAEAAALKAKRDREAEGKKRREAAEAARKKRDRELRERNALRRGNEAMREQASDFYNRIKEVYPDATFSKTTLADGVVLYRVSYVVGGETIRQQWAYGYST